MRYSALIFLFFYCVCIHSGFSQDIIHKTNGTEIKGKVLEISQSEIRYKLYSNPDGPTYVLNKREVTLIAYEDGHNEVIMAEVENNESKIEERIKKKKI